MEWFRRICRAQHHNEEDAQRCLAIASMWESHQTVASERSFSKELSNEINRSRESYSYYSPCASLSGVLTHGYAHRQLRINALIHILGRYKCHSHDTICFPLFRCHNNSRRFTSTEADSYIDVSDWRRALACSALHLVERRSIWHQNWLKTNIDTSLNNNVKAS